MKNFIPTPFTGNNSAAAPSCVCLLKCKKTGKNRVVWHLPPISIFSLIAHHLHSTTTHTLANIEEHDTTLELSRLLLRTRHKDELFALKQNFLVHNFMDIKIDGKKISGYWLPIVIISCADVLTISNHGYASLSSSVNCSPAHRWWAARMVESWRKVKPLQSLPMARMDRHVTWAWSNVCCGHIPCGSWQGYDVLEPYIYCRAKKKG